MLTATISQISASSALTTADLIEIEQSGVSKKADIAMVGDALTATSAQSIAGSSNDVFITPATMRAGINAENAPPIYACRAWASFDTSTVSSSITGTYTRSAGTTLAVLVATTHGYISGNVAYVDFTSGGASDNSYIVSVIDANTFSVNTVSTSSILTSAFTLKRCPIRASGNVTSISYTAVGGCVVNYGVALPSSSYSIVCSASRPVASGTQCLMIGPEPAGYYSQYATTLFSKDDNGTNLDSFYASVAVFV